MLALLVLTAIAGADNGFDINVSTIRRTIRHWMRERDVTCVSSVLVVGGGVAGLVAASALARAGVSCTLVEANPVPLGASILISGQALQMLYDLVDEGALNAAGTPSPTGRGNVFASLGIYRPTLSQILKGAARQWGVDLRDGVRLVDLRQDDASAVATLSDGSETSFDAVIGADGLRSTVRSLIAPGAAEPQYSGQSCIRWMIPGDPIPDLSGTIHLPSGKLLSYPLPGQIYAILVFKHPRGDIAVGQDEAFAILERLLSTSDDARVAALCARSTRDLPLIFRPFEWLLMPRPWSRGRTMLIGDAAHATTAHMGYGGGLALEDGIVIAEALLASDTIDEAYATFEERRYERVRHVVETSLRLSRLEQEGTSESELERILSAGLAELKLPY